MADLPVLATVTSKSSLPVADTGLIDPRTILTSIQETVYDWRLDSDQISWGANAGPLLKVAHASQIATGRGYAKLLDPARRR